VSERPTAEQLLACPHALLTSRHLRELGWERRAIEAIFRGCPVVSVPGYSRPAVQVADYLRFIKEHTYRGDRVRPTRGSVTLPNAPDQRAGRRPR
jgi:hypothetical protein